VIVRNVRHKGLLRFIERDDTSGLPPDFAEKIGNIVSFLGEMADEAELGAVPSWKAHRLAGDRKGVWSLHVSRNWRITFRIDRAKKEIVDLDFEDYH
jgi:proteic killer suppression protein